MLVQRGRRLPLCIGVGRYYSRVKYKPIIV